MGLPKGRRARNPGLFKGVRHEDGVYRPGRDGLSDGGPPEGRRPRGAVYNRSPEKARAGPKSTAAGRRHVAEAVAGAEIVLLCVGNDDDVRDVVAQALPALAGADVVDHTTTSATVAREMASLAGRRAAPSSTPRSRAARPAPRTAS
jgi:hypothetical protein